MSIALDEVTLTLVVRVLVFVWLGAHAYASMLRQYVIVFGISCQHRQYTDLILYSTAKID